MSSEYALLQFDSVNKRCATTTAKALHKKMKCSCLQRKVQFLYLSCLSKLVVLLNNKTARTRHIRRLSLGSQIFYFHSSVRTGTDQTVANGNLQLVILSCASKNFSVFLTIINNGRDRVGVLHICTKANSLACWPLRKFLVLKN